MVTIAALALATLPAPVLSQAPRSSGHWQVDWREQQCVLIRHSAGELPMLVLLSTPGGPVLSLMVIRREPGYRIAEDRDAISIQLLPSGSMVEGGEPLRGLTELGPAITFYGVSREVLARFAASTAVVVRTNGDSAANVPIGSAQRAVAAFRECEDEVLRRWNIDPAMLASLRSRPEGNLAAVFQATDYPMSAARAEMEGNTTMRLMIGTDGRVSECAVLVSSGHQILDRRACQVAEERLRARPAIGADGNPVAAPLVTTIRWVLP